MKEEDARRWIDARYGATAVQRLDVLTALVWEEASKQSLVAASTLDQIWVRHIMDSAQLVPLAPSDGAWLDIGSGGGFPGLVVAVIRPRRTVLVEPRALRAGFLERATKMLGLRNVELAACKVEALSVPAAVISARAVASVEKLLLAAARCATKQTRWLLPRGQSGRAELTALQTRWRGRFHVEQSLTDGQSVILVLDGPERGVTAR